MNEESSPSREESWMRRSALHYLGQRSSSAANLRQVLKRRAQRKLGPDYDASGLIERTVDFCRRNGLIDDAAFAEARIHAGRARGFSSRRISLMLEAKGVDRDTINEALSTEDQDQTEARAAARLAQRKRLGPWRRPDKAFDLGKEIATLARGGFSISLARRTLTGDPAEIVALLDP